MSDATNPSHYRAHPSGIECIQITEHMNFNLGNAVKYIWRAGLKGDVIEDLRKAVWYIEREIKLREGSIPAFRRGVESCDHISLSRVKPDVVEDDHGSLV